ncbi:MAG: STY4526/YPO1902 family pathogenicity island replication protein, partial [Serratia inhibens]|uniref:STY4526/YPO1902 family pathogenicity island replication protein n=1 Tax=Serratia inhibens TaxID=2338073 RepID=UPI003C7D470A
MSANAELSFHVLHQSVQILADDDLKALFDLGFSVEEIHAIAALTIKELIHLSRLGDRFLDVKVDH